MTREEVLKDLTDIFRDVFDDESIVLTDETTSEDIEDWDSLEQINIIAACAERFKIKFNIKDIQNLKSVGKLLDIITENIK